MRLGRWRLTVIGLVVAAALLGLSAVYVVPRYQLLSRTQVILGAVLERYVQAHGKMPTGFQDLESAGLLRAISHKGRQEWQVAAEGVSPTILFYRDDLSIKWEIPLESLAVREGHLVDVQTGHPTYIIESKRWYVSSSDAISIRIYEVLRNSQGATSAPHESALE